MSRCIFACGLVFFAIAIPKVISQDPALQPMSSNAVIDSDYPTVRPGVFIEDSSWKPMTNEMPARVKTGRGFAAAVSYGAVPAKVLAEYNGEHATAQVDATKPVICICHMTSLPAKPVIVQLHPKKGARELDGGRMVVYPIVGGSKMADANKSDLIPVDQTHPDENVWLIRPQIPLAPGEYALMLGTQNLSVYTFSVTASAEKPAAAK